MPSILLTNYYRPHPLGIIQEEVPPGFDLLALSRPGKQEIITRAGGADYLLVGGRIPIDQEVISAATHLKMVQRTGVGMDSLDLALLQQRKIPVYVNPGVNARSVAEHALMLILATLRRLPVADASVKAGSWPKHDLGVTCSDLFGKTVGLVGLGHIGVEVSKLLQPFGAVLLYSKRARLSAAGEARLNVHYRRLPDLLKEADIVSLHCSLNPGTERLIGKAEISAMKPGALIINTARGRLVDEEALAAALASGHIRGAGLDVFANEPPAPDNPLLKLGNVVLTPHMASLTMETFRRMMREALQNIKSFEDGNLAAIECKRLDGKIPGGD